METAGQIDLGDCGVGGSTGLSQSRAGADHGQDAATGTDQAPFVVQGGSGVEDTLEVGPADHITATRGRRVALRGDHHADGGTTAPCQRRLLIEGSCGRGIQHPTQWGLQPSEQRLGLRITEPGVELHHPHSPAGQSQPGVQQADERGAPASHLVDGGLDDGGHDLLGQALRRPRQRRVGPHAAGIGTRVAVTDSLEILGRLEGQHMLAVAEGEQAHLGTVEVLLNDHLRAAGGVSDGSIATVGDDDTLSGRQAVVLHNIRSTELIQRGDHLVHRQAQPCRSSGHPGGFHDHLGEGLAALQLSGGSTGPEHRDASRAHRVGDPGHQWRFRADHDQVNAQLGRQSRSGRAVHDVQPMIAADHRGPWITRRGVHLTHLRVFAERPSQGVLASTRSDYQHLHGSDPSRAQPTSVRWNPWKDREAVGPR